MPNPNTEYETPDGTRYDTQGERTQGPRTDWRSEREKHGWCRCGKFCTWPSPGCAWHESVLADWKARYPHAGHEPSSSVTDPQ